MRPELFVNQAERIAVLSRALGNAPVTIRSAQDGDVLATFRVAEGEVTVIIGPGGYVLKQVDGGVETPCRNCQGKAQRTGSLRWRCPGCLFVWSDDE